jgi:hypothetical protein
MNEWKAQVADLDSLLDGTLTSAEKTALAAAPDGSAFRRQATQILVSKHAAVVVDWRSPPDEILEDLGVFFRRESVERKTRLQEPVPADLTAKSCLEVIAGRVEQACTWRLGWIDQSSDAYLVVRVWNEVLLTAAVARIGLGTLRRFAAAESAAVSPHVQRRAPVAKNRGLSRAVAAPADVRSASFRTWKELLAGLKAWNDHGLLILTAQDMNVREVVAAHVHLAPKAIAGTLMGLLALLRGSEPPGPVDTRLEAIRYFSFDPKSLDRTIALLVATAHEVKGVGSLRRYLTATRLPAFPGAAADAVSRLSATDQAAIRVLIERGLASADTEICCAAIHSAGRLGFSTLRDSIASHARSNKALVRQSAADALKAIS